MSVNPDLGFHDWKRALWRAPFHMLMSVPFAAAALVVPPAGKAYVRWRQTAEQADQDAERDTPEKATVDLYTQTALPKAILAHVWKIKA